jgi:hypothetical protein
MAGAGFFGSAFDFAFGRDFERDFKLTSA